MSEKELIGALKSGLRFISEDIDDFERCACPIVNENPVLSMMDGLSVPYYRRMKRVQRKMRLALERHKS